MCKNYFRVLHTNNRNKKNDRSKLNLYFFYHFDIEMIQRTAYLTESQFRIVKT